MLCKIDAIEFINKKKLITAFQKQLKKQHMSRKIDKNQPRIDNFSHVVITDEKQDIIDNQVCLN